MLILTKVQKPGVYKYIRRIPLRSKLISGPMTIIEDFQSLVTANVLDKDMRFSFFIKSESKFSIYDLDNNLGNGETGDDEGIYFACGSAGERDGWQADLQRCILDQRKKRVFGITLEELMEAENQLLSNDLTVLSTTYNGALVPIPSGIKLEVPMLVQNSVDFIMNHSYNLEGIFRLSGSATEIDKIREYIDSSPAYCLYPEYASVLTISNAGRNIIWKGGEHDDHVVAGVLKLWIRELPDPIMTAQLYDDWVEICQQYMTPPNVDINAMNVACKSLVERFLPESNKFLLQSLMECLYKIAQHSGTNKMTSGNLSIVFGPNILSKSSAAMAPAGYMDGDYNAVYGICAHLIDNYPIIFGAVEKERNERRKKREEELKKREEMKKREEEEMKRIEVWRPEDQREERAGKEGRVVEPLPAGDVIKDGMILKKGLNRKNWKNRWFVLKYKSLSYFRSSKDRTPQGVIPLVHCCVDTSTVKVKPFVFTINTEMRSYYISASTQKEMEEWMTAINSCIHERVVRKAVEEEV
eukprot:TRINITY_DN6016_c0_g1_i1.p1 TRINITY_DN6016_c0_g1~~TRINITY_DN6016_c0_g1_i1.p1  ORF type:complete len:526 (-),score=140.56 TRINITY_DN6016_c0_g1_i1:84-1661(-)